MCTIARLYATQSSGTVSRAPSAAAASSSASYRVIVCVRTCVVFVVYRPYSGGMVSVAERERTVRKAAATYCWLRCLALIHAQRAGDGPASLPALFSFVCCAVVAFVYAAAAFTSGLGRASRAPMPEDYICAPSAQCNINMLAVTHYHPLFDFE